MESFIFGHPSIKTTMKKILIILALIQGFNVIAHPNQGQPEDYTEKEINTKVKKVTVFFKNAQVTRNKTVSVGQGKTHLKFVDLSPYINPKSLQVKVDGEVSVLSINHQQNYLNNIAKSEQLTKLEDRYKAIEGKIELEQAHISVIDEEIVFLQENRKIGGKNEELSVANLREASAFYSTRLTALKLKRIERQKTVSDLRKELQRIGNQINSITTKKEFPSGEVLVALNARSGQTVSIELSYLVNNAGWFPSYDIRAKSIEDPLEIIYKANVHQDTKVDWKDVKLTFSSSNPSLSGTAPDLKPYYLDYNSVPPSYKSNISEVSGIVMDGQGNPLPGVNVVVKGSTIGTITDMNGYYSIAIPSSASNLQYSFIGFASQDIPIRNVVSNVYLQEDYTSLNEMAVTVYAADDQSADYSSALQSREPVMEVKRSKPSLKIRGASSLALPTVQLENQTSVEFAINMPYTIKSDKKNNVVDMKAYEVPASYEYYCVPKIDEDAFLLGYVTDWEQYKLMEGEANIFFEDTYIGKSILDVRFISDTLEVSLGRDKSVIVNREKIKDLTSWKFIGTKKEDTRAWRISVRNNKSQPIKMVLLDQVPVPTLEEIELDVEELSKGKRNKVTGEIKWELQLDPNESTEIDLRYSLKYPKNRTLVID